MKLALLAGKEVKKNFEEALKAISVDVSSFDNSEHLLEEIVGGNFDCVLLDDNIADIDVFGVGGKIKESLEHLKPPIFLISSKNLNIEDVDLLKYGMEAVINSEIDATTFQDELKEKINLAKSLRIMSPVDGWVEFEIDNELKYVKEVNRMIEKILPKSHVKREELFKMEYSFKEMLQNAWEHGNQRDEAKKIKISYVLFDDRLLIKIEDEGSGFLIDEVEDPTEDPIGAMTRRKDAGKRAGGWGIASVKKIMDELMYSEKGNTVLMVKYIH